MALSKKSISIAPPFVYSYSWMSAILQAHQNTLSANFLELRKGEVRRKRLLLGGQAKMRLPRGIRFEGSVILVP